MKDHKGNEFGVGSKLVSTEGGLPITCVNILPEIFTDRGRVAVFGDCLGIRFNHDQESMKYSRWVVEGEAK